MSPACSLFALVRQTLRLSVSTPVSVPTKVLPWLVTTLTCFWRRLDNSSMNLRPAVEDIFDYRTSREMPAAISPLVQPTTMRFRFCKDGSSLTRVVGRLNHFDL